MPHTKRRRRKAVGSGKDFYVSRELAASAVKSVAYIPRDEPPRDEPHDTRIAHVPSIIGRAVNACGEAERERIHVAKEPEYDAVVKAFFARDDLPEDPEERGREFIKATHDVREDTQGRALITKVMGDAMGTMRKALFAELSEAARSVVAAEAVDTVPGQGI